MFRSWLWWGGKGRRVELEFQRNKARDHMDDSAEKILDYITCY